MLARRFAVTLREIRERIAAIRTEARGQLASAEAATPENQTRVDTLMTA
jgi:hypothetical protein